MQQAFYSYLPGARKELKKSNTFFGTIF